MPVVIVLSMPSWDSKVMPQAIASFNLKVNRNQQITAANSFIAEGLDCRHHTSYTGGCVTLLADGMTRI
jgi:hypothetical protein